MMEAYKTKQMASILPDEVRYDLRFVDIDDNVKDLLMAELKSETANVECKKPRGKNKFTIWFEIDERINAERIAEITSKLHLEHENYGIWISLASYYDNGGVRLPRHISQLHEKIGGHLDFSYIIIEDFPNE